MKNKIVKTVAIAIGFALATYLLMSGYAILNAQEGRSEVHGDAVK
jgi:hypothetical protein